MLMLGLRLGNNPRVVVTTTPRPIALVRTLLKDPTTATTRGSTFDNAAHLAPQFLSQIVKRYQGTRLGRQELDGEVLEDIEGAYWSLATLDKYRVTEAPELQRIVVAVDPAVSTKDSSDETAIAVAGMGVDRQHYVLSAEGYRLPPAAWAKRVIDTYHRWNADLIVVEKNNGGDMVEATIRQEWENAPIQTIVASRGKTVRAEPVALMYEQGRVHHVGTFAAAEDQMCSFPVAAEHDDRVDAIVYAISELMENSGPLLLWGNDAE